MTKAWTLFVAVAALTWASTGPAHEIAPSYLSLAGKDSAARLDLRWDLPLAELRWIIDLDADGDGTLAWPEV